MAGAVLNVGERVLRKKKSLMLAYPFSAERYTNLVGVGI